MLPVNCIDITEQDIRDIIASLLYQFPVREVALDLPGWVTSLESDHWLLASVLSTLRTACGIHKMCQVKGMLENLRSCEFIRDVNIRRIDLGSGQSQAELIFDQSLFYKILSEKTGLEIQDDSTLMAQLVEMTAIKQKFQKLAQAYEDVQQTGYGIVMPDVEELTPGGTSDSKAKRKIRHPAEGHGPFHPHAENPDSHRDYTHCGIGAAVGGTGDVSAQGV